MQRTILKSTDGAEPKANARFPLLQGKHVRLEPLALSHIDGLVEASTADTSLYRWSPVPQSREEATMYIKIALAWRDGGTAVPFAIVRETDNVVIGSTRFWNIERWAWPAGHALHGRTTPDVCEIGYTWLTLPAMRTAANTESKLLMLTHAFEVWQVLGVSLCTDARNLRSRAAIERLGAKFDGVLRAHRMAADFIPRDSARFSIIAAEWPAVKERLVRRLQRGRFQDAKISLHSPLRSNARNHSRWQQNRC